MLDSPRARPRHLALPTATAVGRVLLITLVVLTRPGSALAQAEELADASSADEAPVPTAEARPPACMVRGQHPRIELAASADDAVAATLEFSTPDQRDAWYAVAVSRSEHEWRAVLPQVASVARVYYRLVETNAAGDTVARQPAEGAFLADVVEQACPSGTAPVVDSAQITLVVPAGSPRVPPGFADANIVAFIVAPDASTSAAEPTPTSTAAVVDSSAAPPPAPPVTERRFAVSTGTRLRVTGADGERHTGLVTSVDDSGVRLGEQAVVPWSEVERVEEYEGPGGKRILGALGGAAGGLALTLVYFVAAEDASETGLYVGILGGAALGALVVPGSWKTVDPRVRTVQVAERESAVKWIARHSFVVPQRGGAQAGIGLRF